MASPKNSGTITSTEVRELLRTAAAGLSAREEKLLRMRTGSGISKTAPLPRRGQQHEGARAELAALEIELMARFLPKKPAAKASTKAPAAATRTKEKDKIIRALRRLK
ncbi:MAG: hypothetical protein JST92_15680 [Deltaproteobacteria bacterium]|nr:hypothetical protein [Deltaproteobacteria bacterium]